MTFLIIIAAATCAFAVFYGALCLLAFIIDRL